MNKYASILQKGENEQSMPSLMLAAIMLAMANGDMPCQIDSNGELCASPQEFIEFVEKFNLQKYAKGYAKLKAALVNVNRKKIKAVKKLD